MLPNMSDTLNQFAQTVKHKTVVTTTVDFQSSTVITEVPISAVVQIADKDKLSVESIDWNKEYLQVHTSKILAINDFIVKNTKDYKVISLSDYSDYGYYESICEEVK